MRVVKTVVAVFVALAAGCGENPNPTRPAAILLPGVTGLSMSGVDAVFAGRSTSYNVTAALSDGNTRVASPTWTSSDPGVATVDAAGRLDGLTHGSTTLTATYEGRTVSKTVRVVNDYQGTWEGRYLIRTCQPLLQCLAFDYDFFDFPIVMDISQSADAMDEVTASLYLSTHSIRATIRGTVTADGRLNLAGDAVIAERNKSGYTGWHIDAWDTTLSGRETMRGRWTQRLTGRTYETYQENDLFTLTRTSSATAVH